MKNALDCYYDYKLDKFIPLEDIEYKNNRDINLLIEELRQYTNLKNEQDINGEYETPLEWEQGDVKLLLQCFDYLKDLANNNSQIAKHNLDRSDYYRKLADSYYLRLKNIKDYLENTKLIYDEDDSEMLIETWFGKEINKMLHIKDN